MACALGGRGHITFIRSDLEDTLSKHTELSRFSSNGKTFFLNRAEAKNGSPYLAINSLYGKGNQERLVLFEPHWVQFKRHLDAAIATLTGMKIAEAATPAEPVTPCPERCPNCSWYLLNPEQNERS